MSSSKDKNKKLVIILIVLVVVSILSMPILYVGYNVRVNKALSLYRVPYANQTLNNGTKITTDMVSYMNIPKSALVDDTYYNSSNDIVGKCVREDSKLIKGSIFYKDLIEDCSFLNDNVDE